jgi:hypothetical protein
MLQIAVFLLYFGAVMMLLRPAGTGLGIAVSSDSQSAQLIENLARAFVAIGGAAGGYFISNERKIGYTLGVAVAALPLVAKTLIVARYHVDPLQAFDLLDILFDIALFALLVHPQSRNYVRLWFK